MYTHCLFCHESLGANGMIEHFPVGRRLAYDGEKGRLWAVCMKCGQWNLTPLEERWEAMEECERLFRGTTLRLSSDNIGLARLADGLTLVRIGQPQRPELAAWRYGDQLGRRRRKYVLMTGAGVAVMGGALFAGPVGGLIGGAAVQAVNLGSQAVLYYRRFGRVVARIPMGTGAPLTLTPYHIQHSRLLPSGDPAGWTLSVAHRGAWGRPRWSPTRGFYFGSVRMDLSGEDAIRGARKILPHLNVSGGSRSAVQDAVALLQEAGDAERCFAAAVRPSVWTPGWKHAVENRSFLQQLRTRGDADNLLNLPVRVRLALEMAAHETIERQALEGELARLEDEWREAEEIAAIADDMLLPREMHEFIEKHRRP